MLHAAYSAGHAAKNRAWWTAMGCGVRGRGMHPSAPVPSLHRTEHDPSAGSPDRRSARRSKRKARSGRAARPRPTQRQASHLDAQRRRRELRLHRAGGTLSPRGQREWVPRSVARRNGGPGATNGRTHRSDEERRLTRNRAPDRSGEFVGHRGIGPNAAGGEPRRAGRGPRRRCSEEPTRGRRLGRRAFAWRRRIRQLARVAPRRK